jgi:cytochrome c553
MFRQLTLIALFTASSAVAGAQSPIVSNLVGKAIAAQRDAAHGRVLYAKRCRSCHGGEGWGDGLEDIPSLAGQRELYLVTQLAEFATQERNGSTMHRATSSADVNNPQAIRDLSAFLNRAPVDPDPEHADDKVPASGDALFQRNCAMCHGTGAQGSRDEPIPALAGQHYDYTLIQLKNFAKGHRGQVDAPVIDFAAGLSDEEQKGIADYLSRIPRIALSAGPPTASIVVSK